MGSGAKIRIKVGVMELDYEGDPSFQKDGLESLLATMGELSTRVPSEPETVSNKANDVDSSSSSNGFDFSTSTIAARLDVKSGTELVVCALAKLELVDGGSGAKRSGIHEEMKTATAYYNKNIGSNLSASLKTLTKAKRIHLNATEVYSLSATERKSIEGKIADIG